MEGEQGRNITLCLAVSEENRLDYYKVVGGMTKMFAESMTELSVLYDEPFYAHMENAKDHHACSVRIRNTNFLPGIHHLLV